MLACEAEIDVPEAQRHEERVGRAAQVQLVGVERDRASGERAGVRAVAVGRRRGLPGLPRRGEHGQVAARHAHDEARGARRRGVGDTAGRVVRGQEDPAGVVVGGELRGGQQAAVPLARQRRGRGAEGGPAAGVVEGQVGVPRVQADRLAAVAVPMQGGALIDLARHKTRRSRGGFDERARARGLERNARRRSREVDAAVPRELRPGPHPAFHPVFRVDIGEPEFQAESGRRDRLLADAQSRLLETREV